MRRRTSGPSVFIFSKSSCCILRNDPQWLMTCGIPAMETPGMVNGSFVLPGACTPSPRGSMRKRQAASGKRQAASFQGRVAPGVRTRQTIFFCACRGVAWSLCLAVLLGPCVFLFPGYRDEWHPFFLLLPCLAPPPPHPPCVHVSTMMYDRNHGCVAP